MNKLTFLSVSFLFFVLFFITSCSNKTGITGKWVGIANFPKVMLVEKIDAIFNTFYKEWDSVNTNLNYELIIKQNKDSAAGTITVISKEGNSTGDLKGFIA